MRKIRVLYLEDDEDLGSLTEEVLTKAGFSVVWVNDGLKGYDVFQEQKFDICIVDIMMPGLDGYALVKKIRDLSRMIPVIFLSARVLTDDILRGFEIGANDYMRKPFSVEELIARMNSHLNVKQLMQENKSIPVGAYIFDPEHMELRIDKTVIQLSPRTNELLYRLVTHPNMTLNRKDTLIELWGDDTFFNARSMDVFMYKIRKYFARDKNIKMITIRSVGYKLIIK